MTVSPLHIFSQGDVLATLAKTAVTALAQQVNKAGSKTLPSLPGKEYSAVLQARSNNLINDYVAHVGGSIVAYKNTVPFHLYPQWAFPLMSKTLDGLPYDITRIMNAGFKVKINGALKKGESIYIKARLENIDASDRRVLLYQTITCGSRDKPSLLEIEQTTIVPIKRKGSSTKGSNKPAQKLRVPENVKEIGRYRVSKTSGLDYAMLAGDFNPLHWVEPYAKMSGFKAPILHGYASAARAIEFLNRNVFSGDISMLKEISFRFERPLVLPANIGVYITEQKDLFVGTAPGGPAYLSGKFEV